MNHNDVNTKRLVASRVRGHFPWSALVLLLFLAVFLMPQQASSFVCSRVTDADGNDAGPSLSWFERHITYTIFHKGTEQIRSDIAFLLLDQSFVPWRDAIECVSPGRSTNLSFERHPTTSDVDRIGYDYLHPSDNENLFIFRDGDWPFPGQSSVIALTTVTFKPQTGEILDADIEFNSKNFRFSADATGIPTEMDLMNTAVHEIGHFLGLAHVNHSDATMHASAQLGETKKRHLSCDDKNGMVFKYPVGEPNGYCDPPVASCGFCAKPEELTNTPVVT